MNRAVSSISRGVSKLQISKTFGASSHRIGCLFPPGVTRLTDGKLNTCALVHQNLFKPLNTNIFVSKQSIELPSSTSNPKVYTFPTANKEQIRAPSTFIKELLEMFDPVLEKASIRDPLAPHVTPMYADRRVLTIRRSKMNKHKRRKREKRDRFQLLKYHRAQKAKTERAFRDRMKKKLDELKSFSAEEYIKNVISRAKKDWRAELAPSGRKKYAHWSTVMSLEELYDLPQGDYIDKKAGFPSEEDKERIRQLKIKYYKEFRGIDITKIDKGNH